MDAVVDAVGVGHVAVDLHVPGGHVVDPQGPVRQPSSQLLGPVAVIQVEPALEEHEVLVAHLLECLQRRDRALPPVAAADHDLSLVLVRERGGDGLLEPGVAGLVREHLAARRGIESVPRRRHHRNDAHLVGTGHDDGLETPADRPRRRVGKVPEEVNLVLVTHVQHVPPVVPQHPRLLHVRDELFTGVEHSDDALVEVRIAVLGDHGDAFRRGQRASGREAAMGDARARRGAGMQARGGE